MLSLDRGFATHRIKNTFFGINLSVWGRGKNASNISSCYTKPSVPVAGNLIGLPPRRPIPVTTITTIGIRVIFLSLVESWQGALHD
jgi:hypothetical protein